MAITTVYDGIEYRSRLEARWAAFMRNIGWDTVYEPFDGDGYIPDFLVQGPRPMLIEVKPAVTLAEYEAAVPKAEKGLAAHWAHDVLIVGASPLPQIGQYHVDSVTVGWLGEFMKMDNDKLPPWTWALSDWFTCTNCKAISIYHNEWSYRGRPCGCYDGRHYLGVANDRLLKSFWADACNDVKWRGSSRGSESGNRERKSKIAEPPQSRPLSGGDWVRHPNFGVGLVGGVETRRGREVIRIDFGVGEKILIADYAPVSRLTPDEMTSLRSAGLA
jgi:hypothetical protein